MPASPGLKQKLKEPASCVKEQQLVLPLPAFVQSLAEVQSWSCSVPEQLRPATCVGHAEAALQADVTVPVVQLGTVPPVIGMVAQQTCPGQSAGVMHMPEPPLLLPLLPPLPLLLPLLLLLAPLLLPLPPPLLPLLPPLPPPLLLLVLPPLLLFEPPLFDPPPFELPLPLLLPPPPPVELPPLHATSTTDAKTNANRWTMVAFLCSPATKRIYPPRSKEPASTGSQEDTASRRPCCNSSLTLKRLARRRANQRAASESHGHAAPAEAPAPAAEQPPPLA
jgi:hypothetical protein